MKNKAIPIIIFVAFFFVLKGTAIGFKQVFPVNPEEQALPTSRGSSLSASVSPPTSTKIKSSDSGIVLNVRNGLLSDVLQQVANHTNIQFNVGSQLTFHRITVKVQGPNWNSILETLLQDYSKVTVWNDKSGGMKEVLLLATNNWAPLEDLETPSFENHPTNNQTPSQESESQGLSISKLKRLISIPQGNSIPENVFADFETRRYLELKGINSPEEWKQPKKVRTVRHMAKKELTRLLFEKQRMLAKK